MQDFARALEESGIRLAPRTGPLHVLDLVPCPLGAELLAGACARRHTLVYPSGHGKNAPQIPYCARCRTGAEYLRRLEAGGYKVPPSTLAPELLDPAQRAARRRWALTQPDHENAEPEADPWREASELTPSDPGIVAS